MLTGPMSLSWLGGHDRSVWSLCVVRRQSFGLLHTHTTHTHTRPGEQRFITKAALNMWSTHSTHIDWETEAPPRAELGFTAQMLTWDHL